MAVNTINTESLLIQMRALASQAQGNSIEAPSAEQSANFSDLLRQSIDKVNEAQQTSSSLSQSFQKGDPNVQLTEVMVSAQKSSISFKAMVEIRNKLVSAYQDIMNMPV